MRGLDHVGVYGLFRDVADRGACLDRWSECNIWNDLLPLRSLQGVREALGQRIKCHYGSMACGLPRNDRKPCAYGNIRSF